MPSGNNRTGLKIPKTPGSIRLEEILIGKWGRFPTCPPTAPRTALRIRIHERIHKTTPIATPQIHTANRIGTKLKPGAAAGTMIGAADARLTSSITKETRGWLITGTVRHPN
jgi:hypothetical protein